MHIFFSDYEIMKKIVKFRIMKEINVILTMKCESSSFHFLQKVDSVISSFWLLQGYFKSCNILIISNKQN